jgi:hypothetical protein
MSSSSWFPLAAIRRRGVARGVDGADGVAEIGGVDAVLDTEDGLLDVEAMHRVLLGDNSTVIARISRGVAGLPTETDRVRGVVGLADIV